MRLVHFLFGKKHSLSSEKRILYFTGGTTAPGPEDLPDFTPSGSDELKEALIRLKESRSNEAKEIENIARAWLSKAGGASTESIGFNESPDGNREYISRLSYLNTKIIKGLESIGVPPAKIAQMQNALPLNTDEMTKLIVDDVAFINRDTYNTMMSQRAARTRSPGPRDSRRMEALRRSIASLEARARSARPRLRSGYLERARNARRQLALFESGRKSYEPVAGQSRKRYASGKGWYWETWDNDSGRWDRSSDFERVDFAAIRAQNAARKAKEDEGYVTNTVTGKRYKRGSRELENLRILKRWNQSGRSPVFTEQRRRARSVANIMGWEYDPLKGRAFVQADRDRMAATNAYFGTNFDLDASLSPSDAAYLSHIARARGRGDADITMRGNSTIIDRFTPIRREEDARRARSTAERKAAAESVKFAQKFAEDIGVPNGTKVERHGDAVYIGNKRQLYLSVSYTLGPDGKPVYEYTVVDHSKTASVSIKDGIASRRSTLRKFSSYVDAVDAGRAIFESDEYAEVDRGGRAKLAEGAIEAEDQEEFDRIEKRDKLVAVLRKKEALVKAALASKPHMGSSEVRAWIGDDLESGSIFVRFPGNVDWHAIHLDAEGENVTNITYNTTLDNKNTSELSDEFSGEKKTSFDALKSNAALTEESVSTFIDLCSGYSMQALSGALKKRSAIGGKKFRDNDSIFSLNYDILDSSGNAIYFIAISSETLSIGGRDKNTLYSIQYTSGETTEQVLLDLTREVANLKSVELGPLDATRERVVLALKEKKEKGVQISGFDMKPRYGDSDGYYKLLRASDDDEDAVYEIGPADTYMIVEDSVKEGDSSNARSTNIDFYGRTTSQVLEEIERVVTALEASDAEVVSLPVPEPPEPVPTPELTDPVPTPELTDPVPTPELTDPVPTPELTDPVPTPELTDPVPEPTVPVPDAPAAPPQEKAQKYPKKYPEGVRPDVGNLIDQIETGRIQNLKPEEAKYLVDNNDYAIISLEHLTTFDTKTAAELAKRKGGVYGFTDLKTFTLPALTAILKFKGTINFGQNLDEESRKLLEAARAKEYTVPVPEPTVPEPDPDPVPTPKEAPEKGKFSVVVDPELSEKIQLDLEGIDISKMKDGETITSKETGRHFRRLKDSLYYQSKFSRINDKDESVDHYYKIWGNVSNDTPDFIEIDGTLKQVEKPRPNVYLLDGEPYDENAKKYIKLPNGLYEEPATVLAPEQSTRLVGQKIDGIWSIHFYDKKGVVGWDESTFSLAENIMLSSGRLTRAIRLDNGHIESEELKSDKWDPTPEEIADIKAQNITLSKAFSLLEEANKIYYTDREEALKKFIEVRKSIDSEQVSKNIAYLYHHLGKPKESLKEFEQLAQKYPNKVDYKNTIAWMLAKDPVVSKEDAKRAIKLALEVTTSEPKNAQYLDTLATAYAAAGDFEKAIAAQELAIKLNKNDKVEKEFAEKLNRYKNNKRYIEGADDVPVPDAPAADVPVPDAPAADVPVPDAPAADVPIEVAAPQEKKNALQKKVDEELGVKGDSAYSSKVERDGEAFRITFTHEKFGTYLLQIAEDGRTIKKFTHEGKKVENPYIGQDFFGITPEPARRLISIYLPDNHSILDEVDAEYAKKDEEQRVDRFGAVSTMLASTFGADNVEIPTIVGDHERYTIKNGDQTLFVDMDTTEQTKIHSITVEGVKIPGYSLHSQEIYDMKKITKEDIPLQLAVAKKRPLTVQEEQVVEVAADAEVASEPSSSSLIAQAEAEIAIKEGRAETQKDQERKQRFNEVSRKLVETFSGDGYVLRDRSIADGHEHYSLTNGEQDIIIDMDAEDPLTIASMKVGDLDIYITNLQSRKINDIDLIYAVDVPKQLEIARQGSPKIPAVDSKPAPVADTRPLAGEEVNAVLDQTTPKERESTAPALAESEGPRDAPPVPFPDEVPAPAPASPEQLQANLDELLPDERKKGPEVADNK